MIGMHDFIIKVDKEFNDTFKTESGLELYADKRFSQDKLATRIAEVLEVPKFYDGPIKKGFQIFVEHTIFLREEYLAHGKVENVYTIDSQKGLYKINEPLIYLYREDENSDWKGYRDILIVEEIIEEVAEKKVGLIIIAPSKTTRKGIHKVIIGNDLLREYGVKENNRVIIDQKVRMPISIDGKEYYKIDNSDVFAVYKD